MASSASSSDEDEIPVKKVEKKKKDDKKGKKRAAEKDESPEPEAKKGKTAETTGRPKDSSGNEMYEFGNMRYASVSTFKGKEYVNIREYYLDKNTSQMAPGKKGISLTKAQWDNLKDIIPMIDKKFA